MKKPIILVAIVVLSLFIGGITIDRMTRINKTVKTKDSINLNLINIVRDKGRIIINDSVVLYGSAKQYEEISAYSVTEKNPPNYRPSHLKYKPILYDLYGPYKLIKKANNDTLIVIKKGDTLYFKFVDPDYKDPNDPTFSDLFEHWLKSKE